MENSRTLRGHEPLFSRGLSGSRETETHTKKQKKQKIF
jgi:hypothetical protein